MDEHRHVIAFSVLPVGSSIAWPGFGLRVQYICYLAFSTAIEVAQAPMAVGGAGEVQDWIVDALALTVTLLTIWAARRTGDEPAEAANWSPVIATAASIRRPTPGGRASLIATHRKRRHP